MITFFNAKRFYIGTDLKRFNEIREYLNANCIEYNHKIRNRLKSPTTHTLINNTDLTNEPMYEYEIWVSKALYHTIHI